MMPVCELGSLPEFVRHAATEFGESLALDRVGRSGNGLTYNQLLDSMRRGSSTLRALDLRAGDRVLLVSEPRPEWAAAFFAILEAGLVAVPIPADTPPETVAAIASHAEARGTIFSDSTQDVAAVDGIALIPIDGLFETNAASPEGSASIEQELAVLALTSGSTSQPRAVELTHRNLLSNLSALLEVRRAGPSDALLSMLPPAHLFELMVGLLGPLACGARVVYSGPLLPNRIIDALREQQITHALAVPALVDFLYEEVLSQLVEAGVVDPNHRGQSPAETARRIQSEFTEDQLQETRQAVRSQIGTAFRTLIVGGAAISSAMATVLAAMRIRLEVGYGLTETSPVVSLGLADECPIGSVGRPLPGVEVRVDQSGEILVRGANVMRGYFKDPQTTAATLNDGWLRTGDHGRLDADGFLFVIGRFKEAMVTAAGETIYPDEVEPYYESPLFTELCVTALRGEDGNDVPTLFVVSASPELPDEELQELFASLRASAPARFRVEHWIRLNTALPRTASGKIRRRLLARQFNNREEQT